MGVGNLNLPLWMLNEGVTSLLKYLWQSRVEIEYYSVEVKIEFNADTVTSGLRLHGSRSIAP